MRENEKLAMQHVALFIARAEEVIRGLMPYACDDFVVERTRMIDGVEVKVIDERVLDERIKAAAEVRKQGESVLRAMGLNRGKPPAPFREDAPTESVALFAIRCVSDHLAAAHEGGAAAQHETVLELRSGDPLIDTLSK